MEEKLQVKLNLLKEIFNIVKYKTKLFNLETTNFIRFDNKDNNKVIFDNFLVIFININTIIIQYDFCNVIIEYIPREKIISKIQIYQINVIDKCTITTIKDITNPRISEKNTYFKENNYEKIKYYFDYYNNVKNIIKKIYDENCNSIIMSYLFLEYLNILKININIK